MYGCATLLSSKGCLALFSPRPLKLLLLLSLSVLTRVAVVH